MQHGSTAKSLDLLSCSPLLCSPSSAGYTLIEGDLHEPLSAKASHQSLKASGQLSEDPSSRGPSLLHDSKFSFHFVFFLSLSLSLSIFSLLVLSLSLTTTLC